MTAKPRTETAKRFLEVYTADDVITLMESEDDKDIHDWVVDIEEAAAKELRTALNNYVMSPHDPPREGHKDGFCPRCHDMFVAGMVALSAFAEPTEALVVRHCSAGGGWHSGKCIKILPANDVETLTPSV